MKTPEEKAQMLREQVSAKVLWGARDREILDWLQERHGMSIPEANDFLAGACQAKRTAVRKKAFWLLGFSVTGLLVAGFVGFGSFLIVILGIASFGLFCQSLFRLLTGHQRGFSALLGAGVLGLWFIGLRYRLDDVRDFSTITGTLDFVDGNIRTSFWSESGHVNLHLQESKMSYWVPFGRPSDDFRKDAFFSSISNGGIAKGAPVQLMARASDLAEPGPFWTVQVEGVRVNGGDYCVVQNFMAGQRREKWTWLGIAAVGTGILVFNFVSTYRRKKAAEKARESIAA